MPPVRYVNVYILTFVATIVAMVFGAVHFFDLLNQSHFLVNQPFGTSITYFDKNRYDYAYKGIIYCVTFITALVLILGVILVPSPEQIKQRMAMSAPYGSIGLPAGQMAPQASMDQPLHFNPPNEVPQERQMQPQMTAAPVEEVIDEGLSPDDILDDIDDIGLDSNVKAGGDADVIYGTGKITEDSMIDFIQSHPDSAIKFLFRKTLDGKPLSSPEEDIYTSWQGRGLSRAKVKENILNIMEWEAFPDMPFIDIWTALRDQLFELTH